MKYGDTRSLMLGIGIPCVVLTSVGLLFIYVRMLHNYALEKRVEAIEEELSEEALNRLRMEIVKECKKKLSSETDKINEQGKKSQLQCIDGDQ